MAKNKNKTKKYPKQNSRNKFSLGLVKEALTLMGGLAGSILAIYGLIKTFKDDAEGFSWLIFVGIGVWLYLLWRLFQVRKMTAYSLFIISVLAGVVGWIGWQSQVKVTEKKVVVLVAKFDGPEEKYHLRDEILKQLKATTKNYGDTEILPFDEIITESMGSEYARATGNNKQADLVIWGWYTETENSNLNLYIENLSPNEFEILQESETYQPKATLSDLETTKIQKQLGSETSTLISFLTGLLRFKAGDYQVALERFENILNAKDISTYIERKVLYFDMGIAYYSLGELDQSIQSYNSAIELDPEFGYAYGNRGNAYDDLGEHERAIEDYNLADRKSVV